MNTTADEAEALRQLGQRLAESPDAKAIELEAVLRLLFGCRGEKPEAAALDEKEYKIGAAKECIERRAELPDQEEKNPLDDQDAIDAARLRVFGCVPE